MEHIEKNIGGKIRQLRGNMTQEDLAQRVGIDKAIISKIETGKMVGSFECHKKIAEVFGMKLSELYAYFEQDKPEAIEIHPADAKGESYQDFLEILTSIPLAKRMLPCSIILQPQEEKYVEHTLKKVERFIIVTSGEIEIEVEGQTYTLTKAAHQNKGDSLYSRSPKRHRIKNIGKAIATAICVSAPPVL